MNVIRLLSFALIMVFISCEKEEASELHQCENVTIDCTRLFDLTSPIWSQVFIDRQSDNVVFLGIKTGSLYNYNERNFEIRNTPMESKSVPNMSGALNYDNAQGEIVVPNLNSIKVFHSGDLSLKKSIDNITSGGDQWATSVVGFGNIIFYGIHNGKFLYSYDTEKDEIVETNPTYISNPNLNSSAVFGDTINFVLKHRYWIEQFQYGKSGELIKHKTFEHISKEDNYYLGNHSNIILGQKESGFYTFRSDTLNAPQIIHELNDHLSLGVAFNRKSNEFYSITENTLVTVSLDDLTIINEISLPKTPKIVKYSEEEVVIIFEEFNPKIRKYEYFISFLPV